ncbi:MAG TPA: ABC transporter permease [Trebonia sp.]|jgi:branched-chain amino acid transport system permease protein|nr:ABC transporter permease [Trebonia sp.]
MTYVFAGLVLGAVFAILGTSITLTFATTGILNLGVGAMAYVVADLFYYLTFQLGWSGWLAAIVCVLGLGPAMGYLFWAAVFRRLEKSDLIVQFVATIGLSVALPAIMLTLVSHDVVGQVPGIVANGLSSFRLWGLYVTADQCAAIIGAIVAVGGVLLLLNRTSFGLSTRAVVDRPALAQSRGVNPDWVSALAWIVSSTLVALGAVLMGPLVSLDPGQYATLSIATLGAAMLGRFRSLAWTVVGGFGLGLAESLITGYAPAGNQVLNTLGPALPFILLIILLLIGRSPFSSRRDIAATPATSRPPRPQPVPADADAGPAGRLSARTAWRLTAVVAAVCLGCALIFGFNEYWTGLFATGTAFSVLFLSFSVSAGEAGILCLCQAEIAGIGAFAAGRLAESNHWPLLPAIIGGVIIAMLVGFVIGLVGARMDQIGLALLTIAFAVFCDQWAFNLTALVPSGGVSFSQLSLFGFDPERSAVALNVLVFAVLAGAFVAIRRGRSGRAFAALRGNPVSGESLGLPIRRMRIAAFTVSSGIAGLGGILLALVQQGMSPIDVVASVGFVWVAVVVTLGVRGIRGPLLAGLMLSVLGAVFAQLNAGDLGNVPSILFGLGAVGLATEPRGFLAQVDAGLAALRERIRAGRTTPARGSVLALADHEESWAAK